MLDALVEGIVFLTLHNIVEVLASEPWLSTAWRLANLYLDSLGARRLGTQADKLVGLSQDTTCYVSLAYFDHTDTFADYVVHEAVQVPHNCHRTTIGLPERRHCATPLDIAFRQRETFAYACEAYSRILAMTQGREARQAALERHTASGLPPDERVDHGQYLAILPEAVRAQWLAVHPQTMCAVRTVQDALESVGRIRVLERAPRPAPGNQKRERAGAREYKENQLSWLAPSFVHLMSCVAKMLGEPEDWLDELASMNLEPEDGCLGIIDDLDVPAEQLVSVTAFTDAGIEAL
ncbi:hypothetical protein [Paraburkholderia kururiensis]|uniref:hypothetical protein n=1 Tax=Paraburkholderia kururiensis TaxID=984307 RepID=UPI001F3105AC|nr:hypothetical protein [Paraburkholderia kururiensis]